MKKNLIIYLTFIGLLGLFTGCEEDGTKVVILTNPIAPTLKTMPDLTLSRANGTEVLEFVGTPVIRDSRLQLHISLRLVPREIALLML